jgi:hypothetical protein
MILHCSYEELRALASGAELARSGRGPGAGCAVATSPEDATGLDELLPRLTGDLSVTTLAEQRRLRDAVAAIRDDLLVRLQREVLACGPAHDDAVTLYFDFAHVLTVLERLDRMGEGMDAVIRLVTGEGATAEAARAFTFPD